MYATNRYFIGFCIASLIQTMGTEFTCDRNLCPSLACLSIRHSQYPDSSARHTSARPSGCTNNPHSYSQWVVRWRVQMLHYSVAYVCNQICHCFLGHISFSAAPQQRPIHWETKYFVENHSRHQSIKNNR